MKQLVGNNLSKVYYERGLFSVHKKTALYPLDISIDKGEIIALVGESGSGKSTLANILGCLTAPSTGELYYEGHLIKHPLTGPLRLDIQMIFQNPFTTLHPFHTIQQSLTEPIRLHKIVSMSEENDYIHGLLERCHLKDDILQRYPSMLSGGQLQRVNIVRALSLKPNILIADEIITALDIPVALDILDLLKDLQEEKNLSMVFISHDLGAVKKIANRAIVLKEGVVQEEDTISNLFSHPQSAYTKELLSAIPVI
ncbi:ABC transporter ATP-binding protein [Veillonella montpellierensis]|uniref:ABC transporter ATP-binding protein n=1 Tax=Veillonella montpellierensis TaxID=187328 RepID=UPI0023F68933|nr:ATP-binding cassette domain-containing protein [Veillonella montpellierensis]